MSYCLHETNKSAYQYCESIQDKLHTISEPLSAFGITVFGHMTLFSDGSFFQIINNIDYQRDYCFKEGGFGNIFSEVYSNVKNKKYFLAPSDKKSTEKDRTLGLVKHHHIFHAFNVYTNKNDCLSAYFFATNKQDTEMPSFYFNNISLLEHFIHYFNEKAADLIDITDKRKLARFNQQFNFHHTSKEDLQTQKIKHFLQETQIKKRAFQMGEESPFFSKKETEALQYLTLGKTIQEISKDLEISPFLIEASIQNLKNLGNRPPYLQNSLSPRQQECLFLMIRGKTAKEIAKKLDCSHRTIETHIEHIKSKFKCTTKGQLIEMAFKNGFVNTST